MATAMGTERDPGRDAGGEPLARDIMTTPVVTISPDATVSELAALFRERRVGGVPVVEDGRLVGIVTEGDLMALSADVEMPHFFELFDSVIYLGSMKKFRQQLRKAAAVTVRDLMTPAPLTVRPDDPARKAATLMARHGFDRVPVEEDGRVVGIISRHDVLKLLDI
jgi:CBS domain-containing protein